MGLSQFGMRIMEGTRGRIVSLLRRGARTVDELARSVELTDNAVRSQLTALERDGLVRQDGVRRGPGAGKPAVLYELHPDTESLLSSAYVPVLAAVLDTMVAELPSAQADELLRSAGRRLAAAAGGEARGTVAERVRVAAGILTSLGGELDVVVEDGVPTIRGYGCPLSVVVARRPETCRAVGAMLAEVTGAAVRQCCEHGERPRCGFRMESAA